MDIANSPKSQAFCFDLGSTKQAAMFFFHLCSMNVLFLAKCHRTYSVAFLGIDLVLGSGSLVRAA